MTKDLQQKLKERWEIFTVAEQKIANYLLHNIRELPFETAASLGKRVGVSPMTVGRFLRNLGYDGVGDLKNELRGDGTWQHLYRALEKPEDSDVVATHLQREIHALTSVHALVDTKEWNSILKLLRTADRVSIASFQHAAFIGESLTKLLEQMRPRVSFHSGTDGAYVDMLLDSTHASCVVLIDERRYFRSFRILATEVVTRGIPLVMITDNECYWAHELTPHVLMIEPKWIWHSYSSLMSLFSLLTASMMQENGKVMERIGQISQLRQKLVGYLEPTHKSPRGLSSDRKQGDRTNDGDGTKPRRGKSKR